MITRIIAMTAALMIAAPALAQDAAAPAATTETAPAEAAPAEAAPAEAAPAEAAPAEATAMDPSGSFADEYGTTFTFALCGSGTDLCATLDVLKGESATEENLAFVGTQVMQAVQTEANVWKGALAAGGLSAEATVTQTSPDTIDIQGCRAAVLCQTLTYQRQ